MTETTGAKLCHYLKEMIATEINAVFSVVQDVHGFTIMDQPKKSGFP